ETMKRKLALQIGLATLIPASAIVASCIGMGDQGGGQSISQASLGPACPPPDGTRPDPTVAISRRTDPVVLDRFQLRDVLQQLITIQGVTQTTSDFYKQLWDTKAKAPGNFPNDPHCNDPHAINDFTLACPLPDQVLRDGEPEDFIPTALTNRF